MPHQKTKTNRSDAWRVVLSGVDTALERTLAEASRREQAISAHSASMESDCFARLAKSSARWSGLWLRSAHAEKELSNAEGALLTVEEALRKHLDDLVACRQKLAHWLDGAVG